MSNKNYNIPKIIFLILLAGTLAYFVSFTASFFWTVFAIFVLFNLESTIIAQAALICLVCLPILLATGKDNVAEQVAVYAYFLLAMTVALQIIELKRNPEDKPKKAMQIPNPMQMSVPGAVRQVKKMRRSIQDVMPRRVFHRKKIVRQLQHEDIVNAPDDE